MHILHSFFLEPLRSKNNWTLCAVDKGFVNCNWFKSLLTTLSFGFLMKLKWKLQPNSLCMHFSTQSFHLQQHEWRWKVENSAAHETITTQTRNIRQINFDSYSCYNELAYGCIGIGYTCVYGWITIKCDKHRASDLAAHVLQSGVGVMFQILIHRLSMYVVERPWTDVLTID